MAALNDERGMALMLVMMIMMLLSALIVGFMVSVMSDTRSSGVDRDETQAYAVAHAGMEKLTSDLARLFLTDYSPNGSQISTTASVPPSIAGFTYTDPDGSSGYKVQFTASVSGVNTLVSTPTTQIPVPDDPTTGTTIAAGPYQGFKGLVTHYNIMVTARSSGGSEVRMRRELQTVAVPVFQFGLFSENSLSFHAGNDFNFGGRIHTNGDLFLTSSNGVTLTLSDKVTAVGEIVRKYLDNGISATSSWGGNVSMAKGTGVFRDLLNTEGSVIDGLPASPPCTTTTTPACLNEPTWTNLSVGTYNGYIRNGRTGAKRLDLPLVSFGATAMDLIRRPNPPAVAGGLKEDDTAPLVYAQRYYSQAALRILLSDTDADLTSLPGVTATAPVNLEAVASYGPATKVAPLATSLGTCTAGATTGGCYRSLAGTPLIGGRIKIELQKTDGTWQDVTSEILNYGITGRNLSNGTLNTAFTGTNGRAPSAVKTVLEGCLTSDPQPDAILRLQRVKDVPSTDGSATSKYDCAVSAAGVPSSVSTDYWPLALYDAREGVKRDEGGASDEKYISIGGVMYYIELDTNNLAKWFRRTSPYASGSGNLARNDNNGYIVYFSDRRNNRTTANAETGEFGNEDIINQGTAAGTANGALDPGEDVNATTRAGYVPVLDTYGTLPNYLGVSGNVPTAALVTGSGELGTSARVNNTLTATDPAGVSLNAAILRANRPIFFRRALKLTNGANLAATGITGLTIASENPVYVQGNYNSSATDTAAEAHIAAAVIADTIVVLSNAWNDIDSFYDKPHKISGNPFMLAVTTGYRFAAVSGKTNSFKRPTTWTPEQDFGTDGGAHNLLHLLEDWDTSTMFYRGSIVSFYTSRQLTGIYKAGNYTYRPPGTRTYNFDTDFLLPNKLPPGTPMFRDVNTLTFRQLLRPNQ